MELERKIIKIAKEAKEASRVLPTIPTELKNKLLLAMSASLLRETESLIRANKRDLCAAKFKGLTSAIVDRLMLNEQRIAQMSKSLRAIAALKDPVGELIQTRIRPNGLRINKVRVPIGVIAIIYEARPNVTSDCIGLCLKSGNAVILRGGSEAISSNTAIYNLLQKQLLRFGLPEQAISLIKSVEREAVGILLGLPEYIDLVIPRGGESLIRVVAEKSKIPVIKHYKGVCHIYVDRQANLALARKVVLNAKVQRPGVCNALETLLVHQGIAKQFLPNMLADLKAQGVEIRGDKKTRSLVREIKRAEQKDWWTEYLDLILSVKIVRNLEEAIAHINFYGSGHSDAIITENRRKAIKFLNSVDSACVYVNASTRFTDGYEFGLGAEMGISTDKLHARGPMALEELTTYKYQVWGRGQIRT